MKHFKLLCFFFSFAIHTLSLQAQDNAVTGTIKDENGEAVIGASVLIKGTSKGTTTDIDGQFRIEVAEADATLIISYIGYEKQEVFVGSQTTFDITMTPDLEQLDEVVITALGFTEKKDKLGATYSAVKTEDAVRSGEASVLNSLASKASNVQIQAVNGDPGAGTNIRIRGANTITGSPEPLYIIDGIPVSGTNYKGDGNNEIGGNNISGGSDAGTSQASRLNDINPNDIESIQVLKGASAAALWGSRAANGVIVITTKNGAAGKMKINYKFTQSIDKVHERIDMQNTYGQGTGGVFKAGNAVSWGDYIPDRAGGADEVDKTGKYFEAADGTLYYPIITKNSNETFTDSNWDAVIQDGHYTQHDLSLSGGKADATYFFSVGRLDQEGIIRNSQYNRTNLKLNTTFQLADWLSVKSKSTFSNNFTNRIQQSSNVTGVMLGLLRGAPDFDNRDYLGTYYDDSGVPTYNRHRSYRRPLGENSNPTYNNPIWTTDQQYANTTVNRFIMSNELNITPTDWLQVILRGGIDTYTDEQVYMFAPGSASTRNSGVFEDDVLREQQLNFDAIARGDFNINDNISLQATLGFNINDRQFRIDASKITNFSAFLTQPTTQLNSDAAASVFENRKRIIRSNRGYGILNFELFNQLNISLSGANEAASSIKGSVFYPAADLGWRFTEQFDLGSVLSFGKLRATYGKVGVQPLPHKWSTPAETAFDYATYSSVLSISQFGGGFRLENQLGDSDLQPEIKTEWEVGADLKFFNNRLAYNVTYYQNKIDGLLIDVNLPSTTGYSEQYTNAANMENEGIEMDMDFSIIDNGTLSLGIFGNWAKNENLVTKLTKTDLIELTPGSSTGSTAIEGYPLSVLYGTGSLKYKEGDFLLDANGDPTTIPAVPGTFVFDANGFPLYDPNPQVLGDPNPDWKSALGLRASWKGLSLNVLVEHSQGGDFAPRTLFVLRNFGTTQETANRITLTEDLYNVDGDLFTAGTTVRGNIEDFGAGNVLLDESFYTGKGGGFGDGKQYDLGAIKDATFTRLREVSLSYTLNSEGFRKATKLNSVVITATGRNLFLWDNIQGVDPQVSQYGTGNGIGVEYFTNPSTKSYLFSIAVNF